MESLYSVDEGKFVEYPEPPGTRPIAHESYPKDPYVESLDGYINELSTFIRDIQNEEGKKMSGYAEKLKEHKGGEKDEGDDKKDYTAGVTAIRKRRKHYRQLLKDALNEREKFFDSILQQNQEQELIRRKLERVRAPSKDETSIREKTYFDYFSGIFIVCELVIALIFLVTIKFSDTPTQNHVGGVYRADDYFSYFVHISLLTVFGFGYLLVFAKKAGFVGVGFNFLLSAIVCQVALLLNLLFKNIDQREKTSWATLDITILDLIHAMYAATTISVTYGVICGKVNHIEAVIIAVSETFFYALNYYLSIRKVQAVDPGGSMTIHLFGAYFGLAVSYWVSKSYEPNALQVFKQDNISSYHSNFMTLIGTVFVWCLLPSFNAATAPDGSQYRVTVNTFIAMVGGVVHAFFVSKTLRRKHFHIVDVQFATLAAGVAMGSAHAAYISPGASLLVGSSAGFISVVFFSFLQPWLEKRFPLKVFDTRGVHNVHGFPGVIGGFASIIAMAQGGKSVFGQQTTSLFPRNLPDQGGFQAACLFISLGISLSAGFMTGFIIWGLRRALNIKKKSPFCDEYEWHLPGDYPQNFSFSEGFDSEEGP